ncbi:ImuA family protein [Rhodophyticola porphyridii]|uniref:Protein ImuA n=1 Tax=Rhodophyticola porphyridii TaxID=1852017 RepID=A0A3L9YHC3_9RHOB|nr:hypothetical protein [Rhodophyticola porphyridii]RMA42230.1 hypothetical protein D9R08_08890 [Rhodophyticola porphyridii]
MSLHLPSFFPLRAGRVHEVCGAASTGFAAIAAAVAGARALWVQEAWLVDMLIPEGMMPFIEPANLLLARTQNQIDTLAVAEEALKDGSLPVVVLEVTRPLYLREGRRLQLAARAGQTTGLCIIPEGMGSNATETRWRAGPVYDPARDDSTLMRWEIIKNKSGTTGGLHVFWNAQTHRLHVVPPVGERPGSAQRPE